MPQDVGSSLISRRRNKRVSALDERHAPGDFEQTKSSPLWRQPNRVLSGHLNEFEYVVDDNLVHVDVQLDAALEFLNPAMSPPPSNFLGRVVLPPLKAAHARFRFPVLIADIRWPRNKKRPTGLRAKG